jgi:hypothetical protein
MLGDEMSSNEVEFDVVDERLRVDVIRLDNGLKNESFS